MSASLTLLDINLALQQQIGTPSPLFAAQRYYEALRDACGCDSEYPSGGFAALVYFIAEVTGLDERQIRLAVYAEYERIAALDLPRG
jgi:hypothetical protein